MTNLKKVAKLFEDRADIDRYYETRAFMKLKNELYFLIKNETKQILFLIGEPGCGKSVFLHNLAKFYPQEVEVIKFDTPFFEPVDFIKSLISKRGAEIKNYALEGLIKQAVELYKDKEVIVAIDEAQLLSKEMIELIRILADSKAFWFLLAMHRHESQKILQEPQFRSRPHRILEFERLEFNEVREYITKELLAVGESTLEEAFDKRMVKRLYKLSRGNFRDLKKLLNRIFLIMEQGRALGKRGYEEPNGCILTMAAIDGELLAV